MIYVEIAIFDTEKIGRIKKGVKEATKIAKAIRELAQSFNEEDVIEILWNLKDNIYIEPFLRSSKYLEFSIKYRGTVLGKMVIHEDGRIEGSVKVDKTVIADAMQGALLHLDFLIFSILQDLKDQRIEGGEE